MADWTELTPWAWCHDEGATEVRATSAERGPRRRGRLRHLVDLLVLVDARPNLGWDTPEIWYVRTEWDCDYVRLLMRAQRHAVLVFFGADHGEILCRFPVGRALQLGLVSEVNRNCFRVPAEVGRVYPGGRWRPATPS